MFHPKIKVIIDDVEMKSSLVKCEKLEDVREKKAPIGKYPNLMNKVESSKKKKKEVERLLARIPKPPHPFLHGMKKKAEYGKFSKFMDILKKLSVNVSLVEALEQMPGYPKFIKDLVSKKRTVRYDQVDNLHHYSEIVV